MKNGSANWNWTRLWCVERWPRKAVRPAPLTIHLERQWSFWQTLGNSGIPSDWKDINEDFPARGFVVCECDQPYRASWSQGRISKHAYYVCHSRGCAHYGKSVRRDVIEGELKNLLQGVQPVQGVVAAFKAMIHDMYEARFSQARDGMEILKENLKRLERQAEKLVDLVLETDDRATIARYEKRQRDIEMERLGIVEKLAFQTGPKRSFEESYRTALEFLTNPLKLWDSGRIDDKRAVLKLVFGQRLQYVRNEGYRTPNYSMPVRVLQGLNNLKGKMVDGSGDVSNQLLASLEEWNQLLKHTSMVRQASEPANSDDEIISIFPPKPKPRPRKTTAKAAS